MNHQIIKLAAMAAAPSRLIAGLMSGTSLDGLDIALCKFSGSGAETRVQVLHFLTAPYPQAFKEKLKAISFRQQADLQQVTLMHAALGTYSAELVLEALQQWGVAPEEVDLIASHGQTIFHSPASLHQLPGEPDATLQIGDGDHIAQRTGIITLSDFRQKHVAAGGEGAPLAAYGDYLLFADGDISRILLNIGGISNFTCLPAGNPGQVFSTDIGPGNTLMDQVVQQHYPGLYYDRDAAIARSGKPDPALLAALADHPFFTRDFPRTTGPERFNLAYLQQAQQRSGRLLLPPEDLLATLAEFTALSIADALQRTAGSSPYEIYLSGGGMHNPLLVERLGALLQQPLQDTAALGIDPDAKEAVLFALLANECLAGGNTTFGSRQGIPGITMGKISLPG